MFDSPDHCVLCKKNLGTQLMDQLLVFFGFMLLIIWSNGSGRCQGGRGRSLRSHWRTRLLGCAHWDGMNNKTKERKKKNY